MLWLVLLASSLTAFQGAGAAPADYQVIVHESNGTTSLRATEVARIFLKRRREWKSGQPIQAVDQSVAAPVRSTFCRDVLQMSLGEVRDHWMKRLLSGRDVPPVVRDGDEAVLEFVRTQPGGIGYVSARTLLPDGVKVVEVER